MSFLRLAICISGVYSMFLLWAIAQEKLSTPPHRFPSPLILGTVQSLLSALSAYVYISLKPKSTSKSPAPPTQLLLRIFQCSLFITSAAPFGYAAIAHLSYPAIVLGKSCKLIPVMLMNVLIYRRKFKPYKYLVVSIVSLGITIFFFDQKKNKNKSKVATGGGGASPLLGLLYLLTNLVLDGLTNSTQDHIFASFPSLTGQHLMLYTNLFSTLISLSLSLLPLPYIPVIHPTTEKVSELTIALSFIKQNPSVLKPLFQFAVTGALGQIFIFETLQHFGSLTLVTITLTRKLFTMLLSVIIYKHNLTIRQWSGAAIVFLGISIEAWVKRQDTLSKRTTPATNAKATANGSAKPTPQNKSSKNNYKKEKFA